MSYKLFIDDERYPVRNDWVIARSSAEAIECVRSRGCPIDVAFDHDLGGADTALRFLSWFTDAVLDGELVIPAGFSYSVHSQNVVGAERIRGWMDGLLHEMLGRPIPVRRAIR